MTLRRLAFAIGLLALALLVGFPFAERRAVGRRLVEDATWAASSTFERPPHRPSQLDGSVSSCLDARLVGATLTFAPIELFRSDGGTAWFEQQRTNVAAIRECLPEPRVGAFDSFGFDCFPPGRADHSLTMAVATTWLRHELTGALDGGDRLEACLDSAALERDGPALDGLIGSMLGATSAAETVGPCLEVLTRATAEQRAHAKTSLERIKGGQLPFSTVLRLERAAVTVSVLGNVLAAPDIARLPASARACVGTGEFTREHRFENWLLLPTHWRKLTDLERLSVADPLLDAPAVKTALENSLLEDWLHEPPSEHPRLARRYASVSRKTDALLALIQALDGGTPPTFPWMRLSVTETHVHLEVQLNDLWKTFDVDR